MPRKLKTYVTQIGFFELAVAAPSMKAALEAWGMTRNAFHQGFAEETDDAPVVAATLASPGTVLKRAVGTKGEFKKEAELPKSLPAAAPAPRKKTPARKAKPVPAVPTPRQRTAQLLSFEQAQAKRTRERAKQEAQREKQEAAQAVEEEARRKAARKSQAILNRARQRHEARMKKLEKERLAAEAKVDAEKERWAREKEELEGDHGV